MIGIFPEIVFLYDYAATLITELGRLFAPNPCRANSNVVVPERIGISPVRLPAKVDGSNPGLDAAPLPLGGVGVGDTGLAGETGDDSVVQPCLYAAVWAKVVLEALPRVCRKGLGRGNSLRGEVGKCRIVRLAVILGAGLVTGAQVSSRGQGTSKPLRSCSVRQSGGASCFLEPSRAS